MKSTIFHVVETCVYSDGFRSERTIGYYASRDSAEKIVEEHLDSAKKASSLRLMSGQNDEDYAKCSYKIIMEILYP